MTLDPVDRHAELERILARPTLTLLRDPQAATVLTVLAEAFDGGATSVPADRLHGIVDRVRAELAQPMERSARDVADRWLKGGTRWLTRTLEPGGEHVYRLTDDAGDALAFVAAQTRARVVTTGSTVEQLLAQARHAAELATTDPAAKRDLLVARRDRLAQALAETDAELTHLEETGVVVPADDNAVHNEYLRLVQQVEALLRDLRRVAELVREEGERLREEFLHDDRPMGRIVDEYVQRLTTRLSATREGQGFDSAKRLLEDPSSRNSLRLSLKTVLDHPFSSRLPPAEKRAATGLVRAIHHANGAIFDARTGINASLTGYVHSRHAATHRALPKALADLGSALEEWEQARGRRTPLPLDLDLSRAQVATLRTRAGRVVERQAPPPVEDATPVIAVSPVELETLRAKGGPRYPALVETLTALLERQPSASAVEVFDAVEEGARRPVDLIGLINLAAGVDAFAAGTERVVTTRADGSTRGFAVPAVVFTIVPAPAGLQPHDTRDSPTRVRVDDEEENA